MAHSGSEPSPPCPAWYARCMMDADTPRQGDAFAEMPREHQENLAGRLALMHALDVAWHQKENMITIPHRQTRLSVSPPSMSCITDDRVAKESERGAGRGR